LPEVERVRESSYGLNDALNELLLALVGSFCCSLLQLAKEQFDNLRQLSGRKKRYYVELRGVGA